MTPETLNCCRGLYEAGAPLRQITRLERFSGSHLRTFSDMNISLNRRLTLYIRNIIFHFHNHFSTCLLRFLLFSTYCDAEFMKDGLLDQIRQNESKTRELRSTLQNTLLSSLRSWEQFAHLPCFRNYQRIDRPEGRLAC